jgi:ketosteroid isomerase-like protein
MTTTLDIGADVMAIERAALDRWGQGDPSVYLALFADDVSYFDPLQERRVDGAAAMQALFAPITGRIRVDRYDLLHPAVQQHGEVAVLSFNLVSYRTDDGVERAISKWNATEVYRRTDQGWRIWHSHWSFTTPELTASVSEEA